MRNRCRVESRPANQHERAEPLKRRCAPRVRLPVKVRAKSPRACLEVFGNKYFAFKALKEIQFNLGKYLLSFELPQLSFCLIPTLDHIISEYRADT